MVLAMHAVNRFFDFMGKEKKHVYIVVIGHVDAGKSTTTIMIIRGLQGSNYYLQIKSYFWHN